MVGVPTKEQLNDVKQDTVQWDEKAHRVFDTNNFHSVFGDLVVAELTPVVQMTAVYGLFPKANVISAGDGAAGATDNLFFASSGTSTGTFAALTAKRRLQYRAGQGAISRHTAVFDTPAEGNTQSVGLRTASDGFTFVYQNLNFGIIHTHGGHVEIQTLTITTAATGGENATVTINDDVFSVPLTAGSLVHNANEIADYLTANDETHTFTQNGATVVVARIISGPTGTYSFTSATAVAAFVQNHTGVEGVNDFIPQASWSVDKMDGTGVSGMTLDPTKGNAYWIQFQYLGFGNIYFYLENQLTGKQQQVHMIEYINQNTVPSVTNPSFDLTWSSVNFTNNTVVSIKGASCAAFIEGKIARTESGKSRASTKTATTGSSLNLLTIRNRSVFGTNVNLAQVIPQLVTVFADTIKGAIINITKNATLAGTPNYTYEDESASVVEYDVSGTIVTGGLQVHAFIAGQDGEVDLTKFDEILGPGEMLTVSAEIISGGDNPVTATINWAEEL